MTLLEAFRTIGPLTGAPTDGARAEAAAVLIGELSRLGRVLRGRSDVVEDATQVGLMNLARTGPRGTRDGDPDTDEGTRAFLIVVLRRAYRDLLEKIRLGGFESDGVNEADSKINGEQEITKRLDEEWAGRLLDWASNELFGVIIPEVARTLEDKEGVNFIESMCGLRAIVGGETSLERYAEELALGSDAAELQTIRTRFRRAKQKIVEWVGAMSVARYSREQQAAVNEVLIGLSLRRETKGQAK